jgi:two-component system sensor histidine kinase YesM
MKKLSSKFMNAKIRGKLIYSHIIIALIPFLMIGIVGIVLSVKEAERNVTQHTTQMITQVEQTLDVYMGSIEKTTNMLIRILEDTTTTDESNNLNADWQQDNNYVVHNMKIVADTHPEIAGVLFASANDNYISIGMTRISRDSFQEESWYQKACEDPEVMHIISNVTGRNIVTDAAYSIDDVFSVVKAVKNPNTGEVAGVLLFDIRHTIISAAVKDAIIGESGFVFILDEDSHMVYTPVNKIVYRIKPEWLENEAVPLVVEIAGSKYQIRFQKSEYTGWKMVSVASYDEIMGDVNQMILIYIGILILTLMIVSFVTLKISSTITEPIIELRNLMKKTEKGDLTVRFEGDYQDEVSELGRKFNRMLQRIQELVDQVYEEQESKHQAELKIVQEQFKPHFLYNTLDTINWMARAHSASDIVKLVDALTNVFRISLSKGKDYITMEEEMKYISNYLYIQQIRYGSKVYYSIDMDETLHKMVVPKLILQPLVENAIYHGVKMKRGSGHLEVSIKRSDRNTVLLSVKDDGQGMNEEAAGRLRSLLNGTAAPEEDYGFGLYYIKERLRLRYRSSYAIYIESVEQEGTTITIEIPEEY